jgi:hypothetical protein
LGDYDRAELRGYAIKPYEDGLETNLFSNWPKDISQEIGDDFKLIGGLNVDRYTKKEEENE